MAINDLAPDIWEPYDDAWKKFVKTYTMLGLSSTPRAARHMRQRFKAQLLASRAVRKTTAGTWIARKDEFPRVAFDLITNTPEEILRNAQACERQLD